MTRAPLTLILRSLVLSLTLILCRQAGFSQTISPVFFGQNAWMADTVGSTVKGGKLHTKWGVVGESGAKLVRFGGIAPDRDRPTNYQYIKMIDSIRAKGMEPIIQVPYYDGAYSASQAAQIVYYINVTKGRNITYWSIGNEPDLEYGYTSASQVAAYIKPFASAMKAVDPAIKIIGPETAWYNTSIINGLTTPGGPSDITGVDSAGRYYIDVISFHTYPFNGSQTRAAMIGKLTANPGFETYLGLLSARVASCNAVHGRSGSNAIRTAVTELNVNYQNSSTDNVNGTGVNSFVGGQFVAEMYGLGLKNNVNFMTMWSVVEGNSTALNIGYIDRTTGNKKPVYYHYRMMAEHFSGNFISSVSTHTNVKVFSCQNSSLTTVMIMNQDSLNSYGYAVRLNNSAITATNALKINVNANIAQMYYNTIPNQSSVLLQFNAQGAIVKKVTYTIVQALANQSPTVSVYTPTITSPIVQQPVNVTPSTLLKVCSGSSATLTATSGTNSVTWYASSTSTSALGSGTVFVTGAQQVSGTASLVTYYAQAANASTVSLRTPVTITVNPKPAIAAAGGSICAGSSFTLVPAGASSYTFSGGSAIVSPTANTTYSVTGSNTAGCISAPAYVQVTVNARPLVTVSSGAICRGGSFAISPAGASTYTISGGNAVVSPSANTTYTVSGTSTAGCVSAPAIAQVTVNPLPQISVNSGAICQGQTFTLVATGASTYSFSGGSPVVSPASNTTYSVTGTSAAGCVSSSFAVAHVSVNPIPVIAVNSGSICSGKAFTITPSGGTSYSVTGSAFTVFPMVSTSYSVSGSNSYGCTGAAVSSVSVQASPTVAVSGGSVCKNGSFTLSPTGAASYTYSSGSPVVSPNSATTYSVWGSTGACTSNTAVATITIKNGKFCNTGNIASLTLTPLPASAGNTVELSGTEPTTVYNDDLASQPSPVADSTTTGIQPEAAELSRITVFPNPTQGELFITSDKASDVTVFTLGGEPVRSFVLPEGKSRMDIADLTSGIYIVRVANELGTQLIKVIRQ